jgi:hypothetical protein
MKIGGWKTRSVFGRYAIVSQTDIRDAMTSLYRQSSKATTRKRLLNKKSAASEGKRVRAKFGHDWAGYTRKWCRRTASIWRCSPSRLMSSQWVGLVPGGGVEPPRPEGRRILSPLRLPVPPSRHFVEVLTSTACPGSALRLSSGDDVPLARQ